MTLFRRRSADPALIAAREAFRRAAAQLDAAQRVLLAAVPTARDPGVPLADAIAGLLSGLERVGTKMDAWRIPATEEAWQRCSRALARARSDAERLRDEPGGLGFEALNARLGEILSQLEAFADAAHSLRNR